MAPLLCPSPVSLNKTGPVPTFPQHLPYTAGCPMTDCIPLPGIRCSSQLVLHHPPVTVSPQQASTPHVDFLCPLAPRQPPTSFTLPLPVPYLCGVPHFLQVQSLSSPCPYGPPGLPQPEVAAPPSEYPWQFYLPCRNKDTCILESRTGGGVVWGELCDLAKFSESLWSLGIVTIPASFPGLQSPWKNVYR